MNKPIANVPDPIKVSKENREMTPPKIPPDKGVVDNESEDTEPLL